MNKIITIDGPAGSGKSTISRLLANRINFSYLDTGALYRAVTHYFLSNKISYKDSKKISEQLKNIHIHVERDKTIINGEDVAPQLRRDEVTKSVPLYAQQLTIRDFIKNIQKKIASSGNYIVDGRDIGTVVFKDAFCKFFLDASTQERAKRRLADSNENNQEKKIAQVEEEIKKRDLADKNRTHSPLKIPVDSLVIDTTNLNIEEVMDIMIDYYNKCIGQPSDQNSSSTSRSSDLFLKALQGLETITYTPGSLEKGKVISISDSEIVLDMDSKRDGIIESKEVEKIDKSTLKIGDIIDVYILKVSNSSPQIYVSKLEAEKRSALIELQAAFNNREKIKGVVSKSIKGGFLINIKGNQAFCPFSEYHIKKVNKNNQNGLEAEFYIIELSGEKIVLSRKQAIEEQHQKVRNEFFEQIEKGDIIEGTVANITNFAVFVEIKEEVTAIVRLKNLSWARFNSPKDVISPGENVKVKVIGLDREKHKLEASKKGAEEDPIVEFARAHSPDDVVKGEVKNIENFGAFVEVAPGVEGLLHVSELSWTKRINHPKEILSIGNYVETKILKIDIEARKVSLGMKQIIDNPWNTIEATYPVNTVVQGRVKKYTKNGVIFSINDEFEGFLHISDISWGTDKVNLKDSFKVDEIYDLKVISFSKQKKVVNLGIKQKTNNPWEDIKANYNIGESIYAEVVKIIDNGCFVKISEDLEGFCHISQLSTQKTEKVEDEVELNKKYNFSIQIIDEENKKLTLSIKEHILNENKRDVKKYLNNNETQESISLADLIKKD